MPNYLSPKIIGGVFSQTKLRNDRAKWGEFTDTQKEKLPNHLNYLALLLYRYKDQNRRIFEKFKWQLCAGIPFSIIEEWLKTDTMPNLFDSYQILKKLGTGEIGTDEEHIIKDVICPLENQTLIIHIRWPNRRSAHLKSTGTHKTRDNSQTPLSVKHYFFNEDLLRNLLPP